MLRSLALAAALVIGANAAYAANTLPTPGGGGVTAPAGAAYQAVTKADIIAVLTSSGYTYEDSSQSGGDPVLRVTAKNGIIFDIFFFGCQAGACQRLQFKAGWTMSQAVPLADLNKYHQDWVFGRVYHLDNNGQPEFWLDMAFIAKGATRQNIIENLAWWETISTQVRDDFKL